MRILGVLIAALPFSTTFGQVSAIHWTDKPAAEMRLLQEQIWFPNVYRTVEADIPMLRNLLDGAPPEQLVPPISSPVILPLPSPDGGTDSFRIVEYSMMEPGLAQRYPEFKTYRGIHVSDPFTTVRCDWTSRGFSAIVTSLEGRYHIEPFGRQNREDYIVFYKRDYPLPAEPFECMTDSRDAGPPEQRSVSGDCVFRTYRLAVATTGEYSNYFDATSSDDEALVLAEVVTAVNRINEVFEQDVAVRFILIASTTDVFYYNPETDPYSGNCGSHLTQNQSTMNSVIGSSNYDIGHVFAVAINNGCAILTSVCTNSNKAKGATLMNPPTGDPFYIDYLSHEIGHQFGAQHTMNNSCSNQRHGPSAMEPGSASTIMGYAGICVPNVQDNSDDYFHGLSVQQINTFTTGSTGNSCNTPYEPWNNSPPVVSPVSNYTIPVSTPFRLTAVATDPDGDPMTYCWEQWNNNIASMPPSSTNTVGPMFRTFHPNPSPTRYFPRLKDLVQNISPTWEVLPSVTRDMDFRVTVRDFHNGLAGCTDETNMTVSTTASAGPFLVTSPNTSGIIWREGFYETVTWNVANTDAAPVSCANVDILLSYDGGFTYTAVLASNVPNTGEFIITVPEGLTTTARVMVACADNIFFDISDYDFIIIREYESIVCSLVYSTDVPVVIPPDAATTVSSVLNFPIGTYILDVNVIDLTGTHSWLGDLRFTLVSPEDTEVLLIDQICGSLQNFNVNLDDQAPPGPLPCPYNNGGTYQPLEALGAFYSEVPMGTWTLIIDDVFAQDGGTLQSWALEICTIVPCNTMVTSDEDSGAGSLREVLNCNAGGQTITFAPMLSGATIELQSPLVIDKDIQILADIGENITIVGSATTQAINVPPGMEVSLSGLTVIGGTSVQGAGIRNHGSLTLTDISIIHGTASSSNLVENKHTIHFQGNCFIEE